MGSSLHLNLAFFLIYTCFAYVQKKVMKELLFNSHDIETHILLALEGFTVLLGGMMAAFIVSANVLFGLSFICLMSGIVCFVLRVNLELDSSWIISKSLDKAAWICFGIFAGLFRFLFLVLILNKNGPIHLGRKCAGYLLSMNLSYIMVYIILPPQSIDFSKIETYILLSFVIVIYLGIGWYTDCFKIFLKKIDFVKVFRSIGKPEGILHSEISESRKIVKSISKSLVIFTLLLPLGICDSQNQFTFKYQSNRLRCPYVHPHFQKENFWPNIFSASTVIVSLLGLYVWKKINSESFTRFYSNVKLKIIIGNICAILATLLSGGIETIRLDLFVCKGRIISPNSCFQTIGNVTYHAADLSVFSLLPQVMLIGISEILVYLSCMELLYIHSIGNIKYLSMALLLAAFGNGGLSQIFFDNIGIFEQSRDSDTKLCYETPGRLDNILYIISSVAILSLVTSILLMNKFNDMFEAKWVQLSMEDNLNISTLEDVCNYQSIR